MCPQVTLTCKKPTQQVRQIQQPHIFLSTYIFFIFLKYYATFHGTRNNFCFRNKIKILLFNKIIHTFKKCDLNLSPIPRTMKVEYFTAPWTTGKVRETKNQSEIASSQTKIASSYIWAPCLTDKSVSQFLFQVNWTSLLYKPISKKERGSNDNDFVWVF